MTRQEIFDKVVTTLLKQGKRCRNLTDDYCAYRNGTLVCAIGALIPEEKYHVGLEGPSLTANPKVKEILKSEGIDVESEQYFLSDLQSIHDVYEVSKWEREFRQLAEREGLQMLVFK